MQSPAVHGTSCGAGVASRRSTPVTIGCGWMLCGIAQPRSHSYIARSSVLSATSKRTILFSTIVNSTVSTDVPSRSVGASLPRPAVCFQFRQNVMNPAHEVTQVECDGAFLEPAVAASGAPPAGAAALSGGPAAASHHVRGLPSR